MILEGPLLAMIPQMPPFNLDVEAVLESHEGKKAQSSNEVDTPQIVTDLEEDLSEQLCGDLGTKSFVEPKTIPHLDKELAT